MLPTFAYARPRTLADALGELRTDGARPLAGGSDLLGCLHDGVFTASKLVALSGLAELHGLEARPDGSLRIGALTHVSDIAASPLVRERFPVLARAAVAVASPQLRNQGTLGGNLCQRPRCWYFRGDFACARKGGKSCFAQSGKNARHAILGGGACVMVHPSDTAPALVALDATARIAGPRGQRTVPLGELFVGPREDVRRETVLVPGELLVEVVVPKPEAGTTSTYEKVRARGAFDFALAGVAAVLAQHGGVVGRARVVLAGVAPVPWRAAGAEKALVGQRLDATAIEAAAAAAVAGAEPLAENAYKVDLVRGLVTRALQSMANSRPG
jgi:xanthine dehydrogenase YagS FAD-binding subunit